MPKALKFHRPPMHPKLPQKDGDWVRETERRHSLEQRIELAKCFCDKLIDAVGTAISVHETNRIVSFSDQISSQITMSLAGNAFRTLTRALVEVEALRIVRLWDAPAPETISIRTVYCLTLTEGFRNAVDSVIANKFEVIDGDNAWHLKRQTLLWKRLDRLVAPAIGAGLVVSVGNFRHKHVAHLLTRTSHEKAGPLPGPTYRDIRRLLHRTVLIVELLNQAVRESSFQWSSAFENSRAYAEDLWNGASFKVSQ